MKTVEHLSNEDKLKFNKCGMETCCHYAPVRDRSPVVFAKFQQLCIRPSDEGVRAKDPT